MQKKSSSKIMLYTVLFIVIILLISIFLYIEYMKNSKVLETFQSTHGSFEVMVPKNWNVKKDDFWEATSDQEASPDGGMSIQINDTSNIYIKVSIAPIRSSLPLMDEIVTDSGVTMKANIKNDIIQEVSVNDYMRVILNVDLTTYRENKDDILNLMRSIKLMD